MPNPQFLSVEIASEHANQIVLLRELASGVRSDGGQVLAWDPPGRISGLERATPAAGILLSRFDDGALLQRCVRDRLLPLIDGAVPNGAAVQVLQVIGLPEDGLPDMMAIPTVASVPRIKPMPCIALMLIRGTGYDQERLDRYRDIILPMLKERGGYYEVFASTEGEVRALRGEWKDAIFAVSRWPTRAAAEDFWYSDKYQTQAIPLRVNGAGRFTVNLLDAARD